MRMQKTMARAEEAACSVCWARCDLPSPCGLKAPQTDAYSHDTLESSGVSCDVRYETVEHLVLHMLIKNSVEFLRKDASKTVLCQDARATPLPWTQTS